MHAGNGDGEAHPDHDVQRRRHDVEQKAVDEGVRQLGVVGQHLEVGQAGKLGGVSRSHCRNEKMTIPSTGTAMKARNRTMAGLTNR